MSCLAHCDTLTSPYDRADFKMSSYACSRRRLSSKVSLKTSYFSNMEFSGHNCQCRVNVILVCGPFWWNLRCVAWLSKSFKIKIGHLFWINNSGLWYSREQRIKIHDRVRFYLSVSPTRSRFGRVPRRDGGFPKEELFQNLVSSANFCSHSSSQISPSSSSELSSMSGLRVLLVHPFNFWGQLCKRWKLYFQGLVSAMFTDTFWVVYGRKTVAIYLRAELFTGRLWWN